MLSLAALAVPVTTANAEPFVDFGLGATRVEADIATLPVQTDTRGGLHVGVGVRRELTMGSIGARLELDDLDGDLLLAVRAFDYRRHLSERLAVTAFVGAARLDLATPAHGYYFGAGLQLKGILERYDLGIDVRLGDKLARDNLLPSDPQGGRPDNFYDLRGLAVYLTRRF
jgi:hypothetical protein